MSKQGILKYICTSATKGTTKDAIRSAVLIEGYGIEGDAHAGDWHRQVSLLDERDIDSMRAKGLTLKPGAFGENLVLENVDLESLGVGSRIRIGETLLELTQLGKVCHTRCQIYKLSGDCIMPRLGLFARVVEGGEIRPGMNVVIEDAIVRNTIQAAVLTVSDRCAAGETEDTSGPALAALLAGHLDAHIAWTGIVPDEEKEIARALVDLSNRGYDLVLTTGGTGFGPRDITPEVTRKLLDRQAPGLAEAMRAASAQVTQNAWLQRGIAGMRRSTLIVNLPGSRKGATENLQIILPVLPHALRHLRGDTSHPEHDRGREKTTTAETSTPEVCP